MRDVILNTDTLPETYKLAHISQKARRFVEGRTDKELNDVGLTLRAQIARLKKTNDADDLRCLFRIAMFEHDFGAWLAAPGWSWEEGYALFALLKVAEALRDLESHPSIAAECALEAMEAVCYAERREGLADAKDDREKSRQVQKKKLVFQAQKGANAKHDRTTRRVKEKAIKLYEARKWQSVAQAAREIYPKLQQFIKAEGIQFRFSAERGLKTVYNWLLAHRKNTVPEIS